MNDINTGSKWLTALTFIAVIISCAIMLISAVTSVYANLDGKIAREEVWKIEKRIERMVDQKHNILILQLEAIRGQQQKMLFMINKNNFSKQAKVSPGTSILSHR